MLGEGLRSRSHGGKAEVIRWRIPSLKRAKGLILHQRGADSKQVSAVGPALWSGEHPSEQPKPRTAPRVAEAILNCDLLSGTGVPSLKS